MCCDCGGSGDISRGSHRSFHGKQARRLGRFIGASEVAREVVAFEGIAACSFLYFYPVWTRFVRAGCLDGYALILQDTRMRCTIYDYTTEPRREGTAWPSDRRRPGVHSALLVCWRQSSSNRCVNGRLWALNQHRSIIISCTNSYSPSAPTSGQDEAVLDHECRGHVSNPDNLRCRTPALPPDLLPLLSRLKPMTSLILPLQASIPLVVPTNQPYFTPAQPCRINIPEKAPAQPQVHWPRRRRSSKSLACRPFLCWYVVLMRARVRLNILRRGHALSLSLGCGLNLLYGCVRTCTVGQWW